MQNINPEVFSLIQAARLDLSHLAEQLGGGPLSDKLMQNVERLNLVWMILSEVEPSPADIQAIADLENLDFSGIEEA